MPVLQGRPGHGGAAPPLPVHMLLGCYTGMPLLRSGSSAQLAIPVRHVPWLGTSPGKALPDHTCVFGCCRQERCPHCQLEKVLWPQPRSDGVCPCCLQSAGSATRHLCLCVKCRILPGAACPFYTLSEAPLVIKPFEFIKRMTFSLMY